MQPNNTNTLHPNKWTLTLSRCPHVQYFCKVVTIPGLSIGEAHTSTPFVDRYLPGDKLVYDYLTVSFLVDEELENWKEIHNWMRGMTFPEGFHEYRNLGKLPPINSASMSSTPQYSDGTLTFYTSSQNPKYRFNFKDLFPTTISPVIFSTDQSPDIIPTADVTFRFLIFNLDKS